MKNGFTTGTCAAAAAKAAAVMIFEQTEIERVSVMTPAGVEFATGIRNVMLTKNHDGKVVSSSCAVQKPESDDPDVTAGMLIYARVELPEDDPQCAGERVKIDGGEGIGRVTKPGLDRPVGDAAINTVPRNMIKAEVLDVMDEYEYRGRMSVVIFAPEGTAIAAKTFNPRLGIEGGISIIGTSGLVEPMSTRALIDTIKVELNQKKALGFKTAVVSPGNYGLDFMRKHYGYDLDEAVKCSNYIGETIDLARDLKFDSMLLAGHIGKLVKVAGGIMNTHSSEADCRMEIMAASAIRVGAPAEVANRILDCVSTEEAYRIMIDEGIEKECMSFIMERILYHLKKRADGMEIGCIVYSNKYGLLGASENVERLIDKGKRLT